MKYKKEQKLKGIDVKDGEEGEGDEPDTSSSPGTSLAANNERMNIEWMSD